MALPLKVLVIRHGQTNDNLARLYQGQLDTPLNDLGRSQAKLLADHLARSSDPVRAIWSSDLCRASETAEIIQAGLLDSEPALELDVRLRERFMSTLQGRSWMEVRNLPEPADCETREELAARGLSFWRDVVVPLAQEGSGGTIALVAHGALLRTTLMALLSPTVGLIDFSPGVEADGGVLPNTSVTTIEVDVATGLGSILEWGAVHHLVLNSNSQNGVVKMVGDLSGGE